MQAVLDRPHRSNFVTVSTAVNRVAKLAAARRRGGGLKGEEEPKYLGILLKVRERELCREVGSAVVVWAGRAAFFASLPSESAAAQQHLMKRRPIPRSCVLRCVRLAVRGTGVYNWSECCSRWGRFRRFDRARQHEVRCIRRGTAEQSSTGRNVCGAAEQHQRGANFFPSTRECSERGGVIHAVPGGGGHVAFALFGKGACCRYYATTDGRFAGERRRGGLG